MGTIHGDRPLRFQRQHESRYQREISSLQAPNTTFGPFCTATQAVDDLNATHAHLRGTRDPITQRRRNFFPEINFNMPGSRRKTHAQPVQRFPSL